MARRGTTFPLALLAALLALLLTSSRVAEGQGRPVVDDGAQTPPTPSSFTPKDSFLIDCGSAEAVNTSDGKSYKTDAQANHLLAAKDAFRVADDKADVPSPLYRTARVFKEEAVYSFPLAVPGWHFIRLYLFPLKGGDVGDLAAATFSVVTDANVLLHSFTAEAKPVMKEFLVNATENHLALKFQPLKGSAAFINAIEVVNAPDELVTDTALSVSPAVGPVSGLATESAAYQVVYRVNVGGPAIGAGNDTLGRRWEGDGAYVADKAAVADVSVPAGNVKYPDGASRLVAPTLVYASAAHMADADVQGPNFNLTWRMDVDASFGYLVRLFFADIVSDSLNDLYFNVFVNGRKAVSGLDLSTVTGDLAGAFYKDFVVNASSPAAADKITVQVAPMGEDTGRVDALLNGIEVLKISNSVGSLDGEFGVDGRKADDDGAGSRKAVAAVGFAMMFGAFAGLGAMVVKWYKRPQDWERRNSFSSWLLPIHTGQSFTKGGSHGSGNTFSSTSGLGRFFSFAEIQAATKNFDENAVIGVGGFGNVYMGEIDDGVKVAVKRGSAESEQGINEFNTEIQMLSKLRHRHLVSLIGYCDENSEMILVYEYMHNGVFRDHIYGGKPEAPPLPWKQRLEICIGAARGLHYLHTGTAQGIIHRDVKTTNILLDENFVAKVSDFGLSKDGPGMDQLHVSTAVKGSFGYLDPEYFRCQQLTDKSDVYSFGVVLLEALCARPPIDPQLPREQVSLAEWGMQWKRKGLIEKIMDPNLAGTVNQESLDKFAETAEKCLAEFGSDRISMGDVLWNLEYALQMQDAHPPEGNADDQDSSVDGSTSVNTISTEGGSSVVTSVPPDTSTTAAGELFQQLADMKGR